MKAAVLRITAILAVVMAFAAVSANAQTIVKKQTFTVPFQFSVGDRVLPAGDYTFTAESQIVRVRNKNGNQSIVALPQRTIAASRNEQQTKLTFRRYGDQYFLSQIWLQDGVGRELKRQRPADADMAQDFGTVELISKAR